MPLQFSILENPRRCAHLGVWHMAPILFAYATSQSGLSVREAAFWDAGMPNKNTLYRALHDGRPVNSWCWRVLANSATV